MIASSPDAARLLVACGPTATHLPNFGRCDGLEIASTRFGDGGENDYRSGQLGDGLRGRPAWPPVRVPSQPRPAFLFERLQPRSRRKSRGVSAAPSPVAQRTDLSQARWPLSADHRLSDERTLGLFELRLGTHADLALWPRETRLALRPKDVAIEVCHPLPAARGHVQIADRRLNVGRDAVPIKL